MKLLKISLYTVIIAALAFTLSSCKAKKLLAKPAPAPVVENKAPVVEKKQETPAPVVQKPAPVIPAFNFKNIQFEFNSSVLKTSAIELLDNVASQMKQYPTAKFILNGNASSEGTAAHNMQLSIDRANSVKTYLSNSGVDINNLATKGYGETKPIASNKTERGRILNRRVEIKINQ